MAKIEKKAKEDHSNDWLSTYGDMVTLLLTFFVLLYASSSQDEQKFQYIYQAFTSHGKYLNEYISQYVSDNNLEQSVSVENGAAHLNIRFDNNVFFEPNSAVLTQQGKDLLDGISPGIKAMKAAIKTCTINGHTAKAISEVNDWDLSAGRAVSVIKYMDFRKVLDTEQFRAKGSGYAEPIADNDTAEGMAKNRRVEMVLLKADIDTTDPEVIKDILLYDYGIKLDDFDPDGDNSGETAKVPNDYAQSIIDSLDQKYPDHSSTSTAVGPVIPGDYDTFMITTEADSNS